MIQALVERSRRIGADPALVLYGGGNTSSKLVERDHTGRERRVLRIKGSGSDLATCEPRDFPGLWLDELLSLRDRDALTDEEMVAYLARCLVVHAHRSVRPLSLTGGPRAVPGPPASL